MISVTRLGGTEVVINTDLIVTVEKTPDTVITLTTGDRIMVRESVEDVVDARRRSATACCRGRACAPTRATTLPAWAWPRAAL